MIIEKKKIWLQCSITKGYTLILCTLSSKADCDRWNGVVKETLLTTIQVTGLLLSSLKADNNKIPLEVISIKNIFEYS